MKNMKKQLPVQTEQPFNLKFRPRTLDRVIGHETHVQRLRGIVESKKVPSAILFVGPSSSGKTTLARAFAASLFGVKSIEGNPDFLELNASDSRGIDDVREMLKTARLKPRTAVRRIILLDEAHGFTGPSADLLLKPIEQPPSQTMFILGTMEPEKLKQALKNRCSQFVLDTPSAADLTKYVKRIVKAESMDYMSADLISTVVQNSNGEMRSAANIMESIVQMVGTGKKVKSSDILSAMSSAESSDDVTAINLLSAVYAGNPKSVYRNVLDVTDGFRMANKLLQLNSFLLNSSVLNGERHKSVWFSKSNIDLMKLVKGSQADVKDKFNEYALVQSFIVELKVRSSQFVVSAEAMIGDCLFRACKALAKHRKK